MLIVGVFAALLLWIAVAPSAKAAPATYKGSSSDGAVVFFETEDRLVLGDTDSKRDVYERSFDPAVEGGTYVTREVSTGPTGGNDSFNALFDGSSPDGQRVFFSTEESLVGSDRDRRPDVYFRELGTGLTELVSVAEEGCGGSCGNGDFPAIYVGSSADGIVAFFTTNEQLSPADGDQSFDVYSRNFVTDKTTLVSRGASGCSAPCGSGAAAATFEGSSQDGSLVFFSTTESLAGGDGDQFQDIYRRDLNLGTTTLVSAAGECPVGLECDAVYRGITPDGAAVFFQTTQPLAAKDTDVTSDLYAWSEGGIVLVSQPGSACGTCSNEAQPATFAAASTDGSKVIFQTSEHLAGGDGDTWTDVYERDLVAETTKLVSIPVTCSATASPCEAVFRAASADGNTVFFQTPERLDSADTDDAIDIYGRNVVAGNTSLVSAPASGCASCGNGTFDAHFAALAGGASKAYFTSSEPLSAADTDTSSDVYVRDLGAGSTALSTPGGICPLAGEVGCDSTFEAVSADGTRLTFSSLERLSVEDVDSDTDVYQREGGTTRLISTGNLVELGPATPFLTTTSPPSPNSSLEPSIFGQSDPGTAIKIYSSSDCSGAPVPNGTGTAAQLTGSGIRVTVEPGSTTVFRATATDSNGDTSACSSSGLTYVQQAEAPEGPSEESAEGTPVGGAVVAGSGGTGTGTGVGSASRSAGSRGVGNAVPVTPQTRITFGPSSKTQVRRPVFRFTDLTGQDGTEFRCRVDRTGWKGCSSPYRSKRLAPGRHTFSVKGINFGLREAQPVSRRFKVAAR